MARKKKAAPVPPDLDLDLPIRIWVYENVGPLFYGLPEDENAETGEEVDFSGNSIDRRMTAFSGTLEAIESLLELFPLRDRNRVEAELVRLFINARAGVPAPPYASWFLDGKMMGPTTEWVIEQYQAAGLEAGDANEPLDYITTEFEYMEHLCRHEMAARETDDAKALAAVLEAQKVFAEHLSRWLPKLAQAIRKSEPIPFFARVARILEVFSDEELAHTSRR